MKPGRIVLSRRAGFNLQQASGALNGLPAQSVARPGRWGNPFSIEDLQSELGVSAAEARAEAVKRHALWLDGKWEGKGPPPPRDAIRAALAGKNLACWCSEDGPCHADTLIALAND